MHHFSVFLHASDALLVAMHLGDFLHPKKVGRGSKESNLAPGCARASELQTPASLHVDN